MQGDAPVKDHPRWPGYLASLTRNGYFKDSIQGSAQYKELLTEAAQAFMQPQPEQQSEGAGPTPAQIISAILEQPVQPELFKVTLHVDLHCWESAVCDLIPWVGGAAPFGSSVYL